MMRSYSAKNLAKIFFAEAKSQTIRRMQSNLETWDKQLEEIVQKKTQNGTKHLLLILCSYCFIFTIDSVTRSEIEKRDYQREELTGKYNTECESRRKTEQERDTLTVELVHNYVQPMAHAHP